MNYKLKFSFLVYLSFIFSSSCKNSENPIKEFQLQNQITDSIQLSSLIKDISYIPLSNDTLIQKISKIEFINNNFYLIDNKSQFLKFDKSGKFINGIGKKGKGPGEYKLLSDFTVDYAYPNLVYGLIYDQKKILSFNSEGQFESSFTLRNNYPSKLRISNQKFFIYYDNSRGENRISFELIDKSGNSIREINNKFIFKIKNGLTSHFKNECIVYRFENKIHFKEIISDTVFCLNQNQIIPKYIFNSKGKRFTTEKRINLKIKNKSDVIIHTDLIETSNHLFFKYMYSGLDFLLVYNKQLNSQIELIENSGLINDIDGGPNIIIEQILYDNILLSWIEAFELKSYVNSDAFKRSKPKYPEKKKELKQLANSLNENDNPVLMLVKLKD